MQTLKKFLFLLSARDIKKAGLLLMMIVVMALLDMIGVASILPFMTVLANPTLVESNSFLTMMFQSSTIFGVENIQQFIFALGVLVFITLVASLVFKAITTYVQIRFVQMQEYFIGKRLIEGYLHQPYDWFLGQHSADLGKTILSEVAQVVANGIKPLIEIIARSMVIIAIITLLILVNPKLTLIVGLSLGGVYVIIFYFLRTFLHKIGKERLKNNQLRFKAVSEAFGAAKEVKVGGLEGVYIKNFSNSAKIFARTQASSQVIAQLPRFILEAVAFGGILLIILLIMSQTGSFNNALPIVSLYVFAGYRLMPALQQTYSAFTSLTFIEPSLNKLIDDIKKLKSFKQNQTGSIITLNNKIALKNICYNYPDASRTALKNINLTIPAKTTVGFVGATGSGKTTTVDIILGLLEVQKGKLEVDGETITMENARPWQKSIGYVPQHIYLCDDSILSNIALGENPNDINHEAIIHASKVANIHDFIMNELPDQYQTVIGERGVRLSGGQRQRIGIARALYHKPKVIIFDEATSALDNKTEEKVMNGLNLYNKNLTIILIAHRLNTLKKCNIIYKFEKGQILQQGTFNEVIKMD